MIHFDNASGQSVYIPCNIGRSADGEYKFILSSEEYGFSTDFDVTDKGNSNQYIVIEIDASNISVGEYKYTLWADNKVFAEGLCSAGVYGANQGIYDPSITYFEYNPELGETQIFPGTNLIDMEQSINENGEYNITAPEMYDGIARLRLNVDVRSVGTGDEEYLYEADYESLDYAYAEEYFERLSPEINVGGCSAMRRGNFVGRNLDWLYDNSVNFIVRTPDTLGIAGGMSSATTYNMKYGLLTDNDRKIIPFYMQDGINDAGLFAEMNVVPFAGNAECGSGDSICAIMVVRYIIDNFDNVADAVNALQNMRVYLPQALIDKGYEIHWMIADTENTIVLEPKDGELVAINIDKSTNFHIADVDFLGDGRVWTNVDAYSGHYPTSMGIEPDATGLERWNIMNSASVNSKEDMIDVMKSLYFSRAYTNELDTDFWYSEFVGGNISVDTPYNDPDFQARIAEYKQYFEDRSRLEPKVWITRHMAVYDLENKEISLFVEENGGENKMMMYEGTAPIGDIYARDVIYENAPEDNVQDALDNLKDAMAGKQDTIDDLETIRANAESGKTAYDSLSGKQDTLISGQNIKTINGESILGSGNIETISSGDVQDMIDVSLSGYATEEYVDNSINAALSGYATEEWVENKGYLTEHQSLSGYATEEYVDNSINTALSGYATEQWVENQGYLTEHQSLSGKQDTLISGTNIKTINGETILGSGDIEISAELNDAGDSTNPVFIAKGVAVECGRGAQGDWKSFVPHFDENGTMDAGKTIDFHYSASTNDYDARLAMSDVSDKLTIRYPSGVFTPGSQHTLIVMGGYNCARIIVLTKAEYDNLSPKDANTIYCIKDN